MDGVGDYTRRLAAELTARGHLCYLLSLADSRIKQVSAGEFGDVNGLIPYLRLPAAESWPERVHQAKSFCRQVAPDWISWQIVPYGFDPRGLIFGLGRRLAEISGNCKSQVMFHEIWIGEAERSSLKNRAVGKLQKLMIKDLLQRLQPRVVHTHTPLYRHLLGRLGYPATILPLFGNIPLTRHPRPEWLKEKWPGGWEEFKLQDRDSFWIFIMFGTIHPEWNAHDFIQKASVVAQRAGKKCLLVSIGRPGPAGEDLLKNLQKHADANWHIHNFGQQSEEDISQGLLTADFGVSASPPEYLFKSGTAVAMIEHGLPVIATRPGYRYAHCPPEKLSIGMRNVFEDFNLEALKKSKAESLLSSVATQFIEDLQHA